MPQVLPFTLAISQMVKVSQRAKSLREKGGKGKGSQKLANTNPGCLLLSAEDSTSLLESWRTTLCLRNPTEKWQAGK